jgi:hypothetical protein
LIPGDTQHGWRPEGWWEVVYFLEDDDRDRYGAFLAKAATPASWSRIRDYPGAPHEPDRADLIEAGIEWWARVDGDLWVMADRDWSGWPDPLSYSLWIRHLPESKFQQYGEFDELPPAWTFPPPLQPL